MRIELRNSIFQYLLEVVLEALAIDIMIRNDNHKN